MKNGEKYILWSKQAMENGAAANAYKIKAFSFLL